MSKKQSGFTVIEIIVVALVLSGASIMFFVQKNAIQVASRDQSRKTAINAMYYALEKSYYPANNFYPRTLNAGVLPVIDPDLFTDPSGNTIGSTDSDYRYEPTGCSDDKCANFSLRTSLENEADYVKSSNR